MIRELHFPTPVYLLDIKDQNLNNQLEQDIINWMNQDKGIISCLLYTSPSPRDRG